MDVTKTYLLIERRAQASLERTHAFQRKGNTEEINLAGECQRQKLYPRLIGNGNSVPCAHR